MTDLPLHAPMIDSYRTCPRQYHYQYIARQVVLPYRVAELRHRLLEITLYQYHMARAEGRNGIAVGDCLLAAVADLAKLTTADAMSSTVADLAPLLDTYVTQVVPQLGRDVIASPYLLKGTLGPMTLVAPLGLHWSDQDGTIHSAAWVLDSTSSNFLNADCVIRHIGLRAEHRTSPIQHHLIEFRQGTVEIYDFPLTVEMYRQILGEMYNTWYRITHDRQWLPEPGEHCCRCPFGFGQCDASASAIETVPF